MGGGPTRKETDWAQEPTLKDVSAAEAEITKRQEIES
jgi:hypothetical protein